MIGPTAPRGNRGAECLARQMRLAVRARERGHVAEIANRHALERKGQGKRIFRNDILIQRAGREIRVDANGAARPSTTWDLIHSSAPSPTPMGQWSKRSFTEMGSSVPLSMSAGDVPSTSVTAPLRSAEIASALIVARCHEIRFRA